MMGELGRRLEEAARRTEARLTFLLAGDIAQTARPPRRLAEAMCYAALGGGKRFRPFLVIESARLLGVPAEAAIDTAAAIECVHCYSLVHDDLPAMDDDDLRRGRPTVHKAFDEATAILAGDSLLTLAFEILAGPGSAARPEVRTELALGLARAAGWQGMAGGQQLDLELEHQQVGLGDAERIQRMKTGALMAFACEAGAILARADAGERAALRGFGQALGLAFQISDDLLDVESDPAHTGKATGKDAAAGKATMVALLGIAGARARLDALEKEAQDHLAQFGDGACLLKQAMRFAIERKS